MNIAKSRRRYRKPSNETGKNARKPKRKGYLRKNSTIRSGKENQGSFVTNSARTEGIRNRTEGFRKKRWK